MTTFISDSIKITRADMNKLRKAVDITIPIRAASKRGNTITYHTRDGTFTHTLASRPKKPKPEQKEPEPELEAEPLPEPEPESKT